METTTIDISSGEPARNHPAGTDHTVRLRSPLLLLVVCVLALVPFFIPERLIQSFPGFGVVPYYAVLSLLAGWFGITWIWQTARRVFSADNEERGIRS
jgi:protein-S-isoprenylcysteine O-methyltransferase Ste14